MKGYRTIAFNVLMALIAILTALYPQAIFPEAVAVEEIIEVVFAAVAGVTGIGNVLLRAVTNTPVGKKEKPDA